jgi:hypothetical protein
LRKPTLVRRRCRVERRRCTAFTRETEPSFDEAALLFAAASQAGNRDPLSYRTLRKLPQASRQAAPDASDSTNVTRQKTARQE